MATFKPKTQEEIDAEGLLPDGVYPFEVLEAEEKQDKNQDPFFKLKVAVYAGDKPDWIKDNLSPVWMVNKLKHFCDLHGLAKYYESGSIDARKFVGVAGYCKVKTAKAKGDFPAKNEIADYVAKPNGAAAAATKPPINDDASDSDIPF